VRPQFTQSSTSEFSQSSHPVSQRDQHTIAGEIWVAAYSSLREDESLQQLVENYELFFNAALWPKRLSQTQETIRTSEFVSFALFLLFFSGISSDEVVSSQGTRRRLPESGYFARRG
jgi:hypothetical protein